MSLIFIMNINLRYSVEFLTGSTEQYICMSTLLILKCIRKTGEKDNCYPVNMGVNNYIKKNKTTTSKEMFPAELNQYFEFCC